MDGAVGTAYVDVAFNDGQVDKAVGGVGSKIASSLGLSGKLGGVALAGGIAAGAVVAGKALYGVGKSIDDMSDTIRVATGATGDDLDALVKSGENVARRVPASFEDVGAAIGEMQQRTHLAGKPLEDLSAQVLELSRITDTDLKSTLETSTRLLGDWGLKGGKAAAAGLDEVFRASQATGVTVDRLSALMVKFGSPMRQLGFSFSETAALVSKFEAEGVNTELVMGSMRIALGKLAKSGKDPQTALAQLMQQIKSTGDTGKANALAIATFGARAGPDMAAAIREGRFSVADLQAQIEGGHDTIMQAAADTNDFSENWQLFKNNVAVAVAPAASAMFDAIGKGALALSKNVGPAIDEVISIFHAFAGEGTSGSAQVDSAFTTVRQVAETVFRAVGAVVAFAEAEYQKVADGIRAHSAEINATLQALRSFFNTVWPAISAIVRATWAAIKVEVDTALKVIGDVIRAVMAVIRGDWGTAWKSIEAAVGTILSGLAALVKIELTRLAPAVLSLALIVGGKIVTGIAHGLAQLAAALGTQLAKIPVALAKAAAAAVGDAAAIGRQIVQGILSGLGGLYSDLKSKLESDVKGVLSHLNPFSPVSHGAEVYIGAELARGTLEGWIAGTATLPAKLAETVRNAVDAARSAIDASRGVLTDAWGTLSSDLDTAFAAVWDRPTKSEAALAKLQDEANKARLAQAIVDAQAQLDAAQNPTDGKQVDPAAVAAAQKALDDAVLAQREADLAAQAAVEQKNEDAQNTLRQRHFDQDLAALQTHLAKTGATQAEANAAILALMRKYGIKYGAVGAQLGNAFVKQLRESMQAAVAAVKKIADEIEAQLKRIRKAQAEATAAAKKSGTKSSTTSKSAPPPPPAGASAMLAAIAPATAAATAAGPLAAGSGGGSGLVGDVSPTTGLAAALANALAHARPAPVAPSLDGLEVRVFVGDTELRGIIRQEVVQHDVAIARTLTGGSS